MWVGKVDQAHTVTHNPLFVLQVAMTIALIAGSSDERLWGLTSHERIARQLDTIGGINLTTELESISGETQVLIVRADYTYDLPTLKGLLGHQGMLMDGVTPGGGACAGIARASRAGRHQRVRGAIDRPDRSRRRDQNSAGTELAGFDTGHRCSRPRRLRGRPTQIGTSPTTTPGTGVRKRSGRPPLRHFLQGHHRLRHQVVVARARQGDGALVRPARRYPRTP